MLQIIQLFLEAQYQITFATACAKSENAFNLNSIGVKAQTIKLNDSSFDAFIEGLNPQVVLFDRFMIEEQFGWRVSQFCPDALKLLDTEDLHFLRKGRQQAFKEPSLFTDDYLFSDLAKREIASILRCDLTLMISEFEIELLLTKFAIKESQLFYLPFLVEASQIPNLKSLPDFNSRQHFVTIGNFMHEPNWQSVLLLKQKIWPKIKKKVPGAELHIYGSYVSQKAMQLHQPKEGFYIKGFAPSVENVMKNARVCLSYLPFGAGLKGKLLDAMLYGTPCAMNSIASEAMFGQEPYNGFSGDEMDAFIDQVTDLYQNKSTWLSAQNNGVNVLKNRFLKSSFEAQFLNRVELLRKDVSKHRQKHFLGQILQHHTLQSSKYMSKWIEEKNKNNET